MIGFFPGDNLPEYDRGTCDIIEYDNSDFVSKDEYEALRDTTAEEIEKLSKQYEELATKYETLCEKLNKIVDKK